jgi:hypothetical protein
MLSRDAFVDYWINKNMITMDIATQIYTILRQTNQKYLVQVCSIHSDIVLEKWFTLFASSLTLPSFVTIHSSLNLLVEYVHHICFLYRYLWHSLLYDFDDEYCLLYDFDDEVFSLHIVI